MLNLISPEYRELLEKYRREERPMWGNGGGPHVKPVVKLIEKNRDNIKNILDYGCGHGLLLRSVLSHQLGFTEKQAQFYDPGIEKFSDLPKSAHLVLCTDVLEHIEPDCLESVLEHLHGLTERMAYINVHTGPARAILPDGRNAHVIQEPMEWWKSQLEKHYTSVDHVNHNIYRPTFVCTP